MKVIFLDFDGPIIPLLCWQNGGKDGKRAKAWPSCVAALNRVTDTTGAVIVASSTWRLDGLMKTRERLKEWGVKADCIDVTPDLTLKPGNSTVLIAVERGHEIQHWLDHYEREEVESFVIFDDDKDMAHLLPHLIHTPFETGITAEHADRAIEMLK